MTTAHDAIRSLLGRHAQFSDDGIVDERVSLYTPSGVFEMGEHRSSDPGELRASFAVAAARAAGSKHLLSVPVIEIEGGRAAAHTDFVVFRVSTEGVSAIGADRWDDPLEVHGDSWLIDE